MDDLITGFDASIFRFIDPKHSSTEEIFAGKGSGFANGRWVIQGQRRANYTSLLPETALAEALAAARYYRFPIEESAPLVLVAASAKLRSIIDFTDGAVRQRLRIAAETIVETDWRRENLLGREAITQAWGWALHEIGVEGFLCPSAALPRAKNLIIFPEHLARDSRLVITKEVEWPR